MDDNQELQYQSAKGSTIVIFSIIIAIILFFIIIFSILIKRLIKPSFFIIRPKTGLKPVKIDI